MREGDTVQKDQLLARLDSTQQAARVNQDQTALDRAKAAQGGAQAALSKAQAAQAALKAGAGPEPLLPRGLIRR